MIVTVNGITESQLGVFGASCMWLGCLVIEHLTSEQEVTESSLTSPIVLPSVVLAKPFTLVPGH